MRLCDKDGNAQLRAVEAEEDEDGEFKVLL